MCRVIGVGDAFADGMAAACAKHGLDMQYCMALPRYFMQGAKYSNLTTMRTSGENPTALASIKLLLMTGLRREEALGLPRSWFNDRGHCVQLGDSKSGYSIRPIGAAARQSPRWKIAVVNGPSFGGLSKLITFPVTRSLPCLSPGGRP